MATILDTYMKRAGISDAELAQQIGRDRSMISKIRRGVIKPTLDTAASIERATSGLVPMQSWAVETPPPSFRTPSPRHRRTAPREATA